MPGLVKLGAGLALRLISSRAPYGRAGVRFEPSPDRVYGVVEIGIDDLLDGAVPELLADPYVDVSIGPPGGAFLPVANLTAFEEIATDMAEALADLVAAPSFGAVIDAAIASETADQVETEQSADGEPKGSDQAPILTAIETDAGAVETETPANGETQGDEEVHAPAAVDAGAEPAETVDVPPPETPAPVTDAVLAAAADPAPPADAPKRAKPKK